MGKILIIDDNSVNAEALCDIVLSLGHDVSCVFTAADGLKAALSQDFDVIFLDVQLPDGNGLQLIPNFHAMPSSPEVIIITGFGSLEGAELAMKNGAWDFIQKPLQRNLIELPLLRALQYRSAKRQQTGCRLLKRDDIIGSGLAMKHCLEILARAAAGDANVLVTGETGTGKEVFARAIHDNSDRAHKPFVTVDCAALPAALVEGLLFGHEKGAFTGADRTQTGLVKQADGGTLFLDELGDLPLNAQKSFLRVLQERSFRPIGAKQESKSNFRVIAATNRDLEAMVKAGTFRADLLFRLRAVSLELPALRGRREDILDLVFHYIDRICKRQGRELMGFAPEFLEALSGYEWPGNVRELVNALESAIATAGSEPILYCKHLPTYIRTRLIRRVVSVKESRAGEPSDRSTVSPVAPLKRPASPGIAALPAEMQTLKAFRTTVFSREEKDYLGQLMLMTGWKTTEACRISGLCQGRLYQLLKKHGIERSSRPGFPVSF